MVLLSNSFPLMGKADGGETSQSRQLSPHLALPVKEGIYDDSRQENRLF